jgi:hypothetical protein
MEEINISSKQKDIRLCSKSFGLVAYATSGYYAEDKESNLGKPMPVQVKEFMQLVETHFNARLESDNIKVKNILAGHEHGKENGKCHYQTIVDLTSISRIKREPAELTASDGTVILIMFQACKNFKKLLAYCKKEEQYEWLYPDLIEYVYKKNNKGESTDKIDPFATIYKNKESMTTEDATDLVMKLDPRTGFTTLKNIEYALDKIIYKEQPEFEWKFPSHIDKVRYAAIYDWFLKYCVGDPERKKALLLYSKDRAIGKTRFAKSLVSDESYCVTFRNTFSTIPNSKTPKLLILDDMNYTGGGDKQEMWKALVAGEATTIRDCYIHYEWTYNVPCIITTNKLSLLTYLATSPVFETQIVFVELNDYIGPEGTRPLDLTEVNLNLSHETENLIRKIKAANNGEKDMEAFSTESKLRQKIIELQSECDMLKKKKKREYD